MARNKRQVKILEIIRENDVETQEELAALLLSAGFNVTQATVSRDIKDLGLVKISVGNHKSKYSVVESSELRISNKMLNLFRESVMSIDYANNIIVIKTLVGAASPAGALIDRLNLAENIGSLAGDDTVLIVTRTNADAEKIANHLRSLF